jgi:hypothetical protein
MPKQWNGATNVPPSPDVVWTCPKIDIAIRRPTADLIQNQDILQVEGNASTYRINSGYQTIENFWVKITATKIEGSWQKRMA